MTGQSGISLPPHLTFMNLTIHVGRLLPVPLASQTFRFSPKRPLCIYIAA